jgi:hypothetical protein
VGNFFEAGLERMIHDTQAIAQHGRPENRSRLEPAFQHYYLRTKGCELHDVLLTKTEKKEQPRLIAQ